MYSFWEYWFYCRVIFITVWETVSKQFKKSFRALTNSFSDDTAYFVGGSALPIRDAQFNFSYGIPVRYVYSFGTHHVTSWHDILLASDQRCAPHTIDVLDATLTVEHPDYAWTADMTEFFQTTTFGVAPPFAIWMGIWAAENGVVIDPTATWAVHLTTATGDDYTFRLHETAEQMEKAERDWNSVHTPFAMHRQAPNPPMPLRIRTPVSPPIAE